MGTNYPRIENLAITKNMNNYATKFLNKVVNVKVDRPLGSKHSKHDIYYSFNYGYIPGELAPGGEV